MTVLLFNIWFSFQYFEHLLCRNPFLFHDFFGKGRRSKRNKQIFLISLDHVRVD